VDENQKQDLSDHSLAVLISILNRVVDDAVMTALATDFGDVTRSHGVVFEMLDPGGSRVADLARRARMSRQAMGELVEDLERLGYVERRPDPGDGRAKLVLLTDKGAAALQSGIAGVEALQARWRELLGPAREQMVRESLVALVSTFGRDHVR
jgi:DNA-binding MarR family transcriptional regulator